MPRKARKSYETSYFHVIVQGYEKQYIFQTEESKKCYLSLLLSEIEKYQVELLAYCIMGNHMHALIFCKTIDQMSKLMKSVNTKFAHYYNRENNRVGYVFRDRFVSEPIMSEKQLLNTLVYIHRNPVEANLVKTPEEYPFSSYVDFLYKNGIVTNNVLMRLFGCENDYLNLFLFLHSSKGDGMEFSNDPTHFTLSDCKKVVRKILDSYAIETIEKNDVMLQRYFFNLFLKKGIKAYHIRKIFSISYEKLKAILG